MNWTVLLGTCIAWLAAHWPELAGAILSALAVWLTARRTMWSYPISLAATILYTWVFVHSKLYSDTMLQGVFAIAIIYGWVHWAKNLDVGGLVKIAPLALRRILWHLVVGVAISLALGYAMAHWTDAALPWLDSALAAFSLVGTWWQDRRHIAAWWLWIVVDTIYVGEYIYKDLSITALLYAGFVVLSVIGLRKWTQASRQKAECLPDDMVAEQVESGCGP